MLAEQLKLIPHLKINLTFPQDCVDELISINHFYGLSLKEKFPQHMREAYFDFNQGHALKSYSGQVEHAYYTPNSDAIDVDEKYLTDIKYYPTSTWTDLPKTTTWITEHLCSEENMKMVCLHKMKANAKIDWHSHYHHKEDYHTGIVHISLVTNDKDLSQVKLPNETIEEKIYPQKELWLFNSWLQHRSINEGNNDRIHLVLECQFSDDKFKSVIEDSINV